MKRFLKNDRYQLSMRDQEDVWRGIQQQSGRAAGAGRSRWRGGWPVFGMTTLVAAVLMAAVWLHDKDAPEKIARQARRELPEQALVQQTRPAAGESATVGAEAGQTRGNETKPGQVLTTGEQETTEEQEAARARAYREGFRAKLDSWQEAKKLEFQTAPEDEPALDRIALEGRPGRGSTDAVKVKESPMGRVKGSGEHKNGHPAAAAPAPPPAVARTEVPLMGKLDRSSGKAGSQSAEGIRRVVMKDEECMDEVVLSPTVPRPGSVTGGTTPPNGQQFELMYFQHTGVNPFVATEEDALSTFAVDVDNASYTLVRNYLGRGAIPPADAVRVEEFVNFFDGGYPALESGRAEHAFAVHTDGSESLFGSGYQMLRVGLQGMTITDEDRKPCTLIFVIDVSGSMNRENRLGTVKRSLGILLDQLGQGDRVGLVTYGSHGQVVLKPTGLENRERIEQAILRLVPGGSTNACEGLDLAYDLARRHRDPDGVNRLILCSDGVANMGGTTRAEEMLARVKHSSSEGISLSTVGFGMGNYNDVLMETLADRGDGNYNYVDSMDEARRVFKENLTGLLETIARQVKIQVEFDPERVDRWRLLGYENRDVADRDFRNDKVDAGEVGAGHQVTALYELKLNAGVEGGDKLGTVRVRYQHPAHDGDRADQVEEMEHVIRARDVEDRFSAAPVAYRQQAVAAEFAEILRGSYWARESSLDTLAVEAGRVADAIPRGSRQRDQAEELIRMIRKAAQLKKAAPSKRDRAPRPGEDPTIDE